MDIIRKDEGGNEQDLKPLDPVLLKPLQNLPPGKLPGVSFDPSEASVKPPTSIFNPETMRAAAAANLSAGNSPKRRRIDSSPQNVTIQHF